MHHIRWRKRGLDRLLNEGYNYHGHLTEVTWAARNLMVVSVTTSKEDNKQKSTLSNDRITAGCITNAVGQIYFYSPGAYLHNLTSPLQILFLVQGTQTNHIACVLKSTFGCYSHTVICLFHSFQYLPILRPVVSPVTSARMYRALVSGFLPLPG